LPDAITGALDPRLCSGQSEQPSRIGRFKSSAPRNPIVPRAGAS
jgi:hypothetical protein